MLLWDRRREHLGEMLISKDKLHDIYEHIKHKVQAAEGSVLICVAGETDAMAACHIFMVSTPACRSGARARSLRLLCAQPCATVLRHTATVLSPALGFLSR